MKLTLLLAWVLGTLLTTAEASPLPQSTQEPASERLIEVLSELGYADPALPLGGDETIEEELLEEYAWATEQEQGLFFEPIEEQRLLIGIYTQEPTELLAYHLGVEPEEAIVITGTVAQYPARKAGLSEHDVIVGVEGRSKANLDVLRKALSEKQPGESLRLTVVQRGVKRELEVPLFMPEADASALEYGFESIEEEVEVVEELNFMREQARIEALDRKLRGQARRAELAAERAQLQARRAQLDAELAVMDMESERVKAEKKQVFRLREAELRSEAEALEGALNDMQHKLDRLEAEWPQARNAAPSRLRFGRAHGGSGGAYVLDDPDEEESMGSIVFFDEEDGFSWNDEEVEEFGDEVMDRMDDLEDRLERIEDLLLQIIDRNR